MCPNFPGPPGGQFANHLPTNRPKLPSYTLKIPECPGSRVYAGSLWIPGPAAKSAIRCHTAQL